MYKRNKGTSNSGNKETYWTIFTSTFYSSVIQVLQHVQCLSSQYPRNMNNLSCIVCALIFSAGRELCSVKYLVLRGQTILGFMMFWICNSSFLFNMYITGLVKSQVKNTHKHPPQNKHSGPPSWNLLFPECLPSAQPWPSSKESAASYLYQKVTWSHVNRPVIL